MAAQYTEIVDLGAEVLGISTDSVFAHKIFAETSPSARKVTYPLLSDPTHEISRCYGALDPRTGFASRTTVIVSPEGEVIYFCKYPGPVGRSARELVRMLQALEFARETGLGAPGDWRPTEPGVPTDWDLVGEI